MKGGSESQSQHNLTTSMWLFNSLRDFFGFWWFHFTDFFPHTLRSRRSAPWWQNNCSCRFNLKRQQPMRGGEGKSNPSLWESLKVEAIPDQEKQVGGVSGLGPGYISPSTSPKVDEPWLVQSLEQTSRRTYNYTKYLKKSKYSQTITVTFVWKRGCGYLRDFWRFTLMVWKWTILTTKPVFQPSAAGAVCASALNRTLMKWLQDPSVFDLWHKATRLNVNGV